MRCTALGMAEIDRRRLLPVTRPTNSTIAVVSADKRRQNDNIACTDGDIMRRTAARRGHRAGVTLAAAVAGYATLMMMMMIEPPLKPILGSRGGGGEWSTGARVLLLAGSLKRQHIP